MFIYTWFFMETVVSFCSFYINCYECLQFMLLKGLQSTPKSAPKTDQKCTSKAIQFRFRHSLVIEEMHCNLESQFVTILSFACCHNLRTMGTKNSQELTFWKPEMVLSPSPSMLYLSVIGSCICGCSLSIDCVHFAGSRRYSRSSVFLVQSYH